MNKPGLTLHRIAVGCVLFWVLNLLVHVRTFGLVVVVSPMIWLALAYVLFRWPRQTGIWLGLFMLGVVVFQYCALSLELKDPQFAKMLEPSKNQHIVRFWLSVIPLIMAGLCSLPLRWMPEWSD
jgi:hypothetical protein